VKHVTRASSILVALLLLIAFAQGGSPGPVEAVVTLAEDDVLWTDSAGEAVTHVKPDTTAYLYVKDAGLNAPVSGTATWYGQAAAAGTAFALPSGNIAGAATTGTFTLSATGYNTTSSSSTPLSAQPTVTVGTSAAFVISHDVDAGTFAIFTDPGTTATTTASFSFHTADSYAASANRVKVTATSDAAGEWVAISEEVFGDATVTSTSGIFGGSISLSSSADAQGEGDGSVWVQDGDSLVVTYYDSAGAIIDSATITVDSVDPAFSSVTPAGGTVTSETFPQVTFDVTDIGAGLSAGSISVAINGTTVSGLAAYPIADGFRGQFTTSKSWKNTTTSGDGYSVADSTAFDIVITATDAAGNTATNTVSMTIDETAPTLATAVTGAAANSVVLTFSEVVTAVAAADFTVAGAAASAAALDADDATKVTITAASNLDADATPVIAVATGSLKDAALNAVASGSTITATDGISPSLTNVVDKSLAILADVVAITSGSDERIAGGVTGLKITTAGPSGATSNGAATVTSPTPNNFAASITVAAGDTSGQYGVSIQGSDGTNTIDNLTDVAAESVTTVAGATTITLANGPLGDANFDGSITAADITLVGAANETSSVITAVDASTRTLTVSGLSAGTHAVTYSYVGTDKFEIDQLAPTVVVDQAGATIRDTSPYLRMVWDEDEYTGDSYTTVTLTKAELTDPDGTVLDLLASFKTDDNKEFLYGTTDLALGAYSLTVSATDSAANEGTATVTFTVAKRTQTIALRPGWNLISLADAPADGAIATVMSGLEADIVLTYDPKAAGGWQTAIRDSAGWSGDLASMDSSKAYWIHTSDFESLVVDVPGLVAGVTGRPAAYRLVAGWNLIPVGVSDLSTTTRDADEYLSGLSWSRAFSYSNLNNAFTTIVPDGNVSDDTEIAVGQGYWVFLTAAGDLVP